MDEQLDKFVNQIIEDKALPGVNPEVHAQLASDLKAQLLDQINRAVINELSEDQVTAFIALLDDPATTDETLQQFITDSGVDSQRVTAVTMLRFRDLYIQPTLEESK